MVEQAARTVTECPTAIGDHDTRGIVQTETSCDQLQRARRCAPIKRTLGTDSAKFLPKPRIDGGGRDRPVAGPSDFRVFKRERRKECATLDRPPPWAR